MNDLKNLKITNGDTLLLKQCQISDQDIETLITVFKENTHLSKITKLDLSNNSISAEDAKQLVSLVGISHIHTIYIDNNQIGDEGAKALLSIPQLRHLSMINNNIGNAAFAKMDTVCNLESLNIAKNKIKGDALRIIANFSLLKRLNIASNSISDQDITHLNACKRLSILNINDNDITNEGLKELQNIKTIDVLHCNKNQFNNDGLLTLLNNQNLQLLDASNNEIKFNNSLLNALYKNKTITRFGYKNTLFTIEDDKVLNDVITRNRSHIPTPLLMRCLTLLRGINQTESIISILPVDMLMLILLELYRIDGPYDKNTKLFKQTCLFFMDNYKIKELDEQSKTDFSRMRKKEKKSDQSIKSRIDSMSETSEKQKSNCNIM